MNETDETTEINISWSQLRTHSECHSKSYLHRTGHRSPVKDKRNFFPGIVCDSVMRRWLNADEQAPGAMVTMVEEVMNKEESNVVEKQEGVVKWRDNEDKSRVVDFCKQAVSILEPCLNELVVPYRYEVAKRFKAPVLLPYSNDEYRTVNLIGEMDLLVQHDDGFYNVYDLKITRDNSYWRKTTGQLVFYDIATQLLFDVDRCRETGLIQPMCNSPILTFQLGDTEYSQMWGRIHRYAIDVWRGNVAPKESAVGCNWCDVKHSCPKFRPSGGNSFLGGLTLEELL